MTEEEKNTVLWHVFIQWLKAEEMLAHWGRVATGPVELSPNTIELWYLQEGVRC